MRVPETRTEGLIRLTRFQSHAVPLWERAHLQPQAQRVDLETLHQIGLQSLSHGEDRLRGIGRDGSADWRQYSRDRR